MLPAGAVARGSWSPRRPQLSRPDPKPPSSFLGEHAPRKTPAEAAEEKRKECGVESTRDAATDGAAPAPGPGLWLWGAALELTGGFGNIC